MASSTSPLPKPVQGQPCPCGSGKSYELCCEPIIKGLRPADTAENLMRARFSAHVAGEHAFLHTSVLENKNKPFTAPLVEPKSPWTRLVIHNHDTGRSTDTATVEFSAFFVEGDMELAHQEKAEFKKIGNDWIYTKALRLGPAPIKNGPKVGRNDPCPCGSGKKFKQCCAVK